MASNDVIKPKKGSNKTALDKNRRYDSQRSLSFDDDNTNPLAVLISLPLASLHRSVSAKKKKRL
jgi:hypothetical protein